jgi:uncharacterized protein YkwD
MLGTGMAILHPTGSQAAAQSGTNSSGQSQSGQRLSGQDPAASAPPATFRPAASSAADVPFNNDDDSAEQQLLVLANQSRRQAGLAPLSLDAGLSQAARLHAEAMLEAHQLSHQFDGEAGLAQRLAVATRLQLEQEGENVALDYDAARGHQHLMLSPPHRANLLNPAYNVVGLGVLRSGGRLYIVEDFGRALPTYSGNEVKSKIESAVHEARHHAAMPDLQRRDPMAADDAACSMAQADKLGTDPVRKLAQRYTMMTYTSMSPEILPDGATTSLTSRGTQTFSIGTCYARTETYPTGVYWVVLLLD